MSSGDSAGGAILRAVRVRSFRPWQLALAGVALISVVLFASWTFVAAPPQTPLAPLPMRTNLVPQVVNVQWGDSPHERLDILRHPVRDPGGNPFIVYRHLGALLIGDKCQPWQTSYPGNSLAWYLTEHRIRHLERHFDFVSIGTDQGGWGIPTPIQHLPAGQCTETPTNPIYWPDSYQSTLDALGYLQDHAVELELDRTRMNLCGASVGAMQFLGFELVEDLPVRGVVLHTPLPDVRNNVCHWSLLQGYLGITSQGQYDALPAATLEALSSLWRIQSGLFDPARWRDTYIVWPILGTGVPPYGDPGQPMSNVHDVAQFYTLTGALDAAGLPWQGEVYERGVWESSAQGQEINGRIYAFLASANYP